MIKIIKNFYDSFAKNIIRNYLVTVNTLWIIFGIIFSNLGMLPFKSGGDFLFFLLLLLGLAIYRPGWAFLFFIGSLALENINVAPKGFGISIRPYQLLGFVTIISLFIGFFTKRFAFSFPKWKWQDGLILIFLIAGFISALGALHKGVALKQSAIIASFGMLYFLVRIYIQSLSDLKKILPFFFSSAIIVCFYGIWQSLRFMQGFDSFEVMLGRPNGTFAEADWYGIYLVFVLASLYGLIYYLSKKLSVNIHQSLEQLTKNMKLMTDDRLLMTIYYKRLALLYAGIVLLITSLMLTVSRSAWLGVGFVFFVFLIIILTDGKWRISTWKWKKMLGQFICIAVSALASLFLIWMFHLTNFQLGSRAVSTGGLQKITISCARDQNLILPPQKINNLEELPQYGCFHIKLEDITKEKEQGNIILEVYRPDPNVNIRREIYRKTITELKVNPFLGIGWGNIGYILGNDERGTGLNSSNIFLETWLGAGIVGFISLTVLLGYIFMLSFLNFMKERKMISMAFLLLAWVGFVTPNLFNAGIFLGFFWVYLAIAISLLNEKNIKNNL